jgi:exosortase/archaeosortase family protein
MNKTQNIFTRYLIVLTLGLGNFYILSKILTKPTIHATYKIMRILTPAILNQDTIQTNFVTIQLVPACIAISAFYLLIFLLLATANIELKTRIKAILAATITLLVLNVTRILLLTTIINKPYFEIIHWTLWHILSTILVVTIYIAVIKLYKIKSIPVYDDLKYLKSQIKFKKSKKNKKKVKKTKKKKHKK